MRTVGDLAFAYGTDPVMVEAIGLVTGLDHTGSDPPPSPERAALIEEMQKRNVERPHQVLASPHTALVLVRGYLRPGVREGDRFDIEVRVPTRSETTSLRGGWLLDTRLKQIRAANSQIREGHMVALASGPILVDPGAAAEADEVLMNRGRILGGGVSRITRSLGLVLRPDAQTVRNSSLVGTAINSRFHTFNRGIKEGVAKPKTDEYIELAVHPRYKDNTSRYIQVVRSIPLRESPTERIARLKRLEEQLLDPASSDIAALRLEALGKEGIDVLARGLDATDPAIRFFAAEALAYLDDGRAVEPLADAASNEPAFRVFALAALSTMNDYAAEQSLRDLLHVASAETRYGAFRALWRMNPHIPEIVGEDLEGQFSYHVVRSDGPPMIHVTRTYRPEIVLFGHDQHLRTPVLLDAGKKVLVRADSPQQVTVVRVALGEASARREVSPRLDEIIRAIVELGGTFPDVVQMLQEAKAKGVLSGRFEVDALPEAGRTYVRRDPQRDLLAESLGTLPRESSQSIVVAGPLPDMFEGPAVLRKGSAGGK